MSSKRHILYVIGAGLSKSLELSRARIPLMYGFIDVMADYIEEPSIVTALSVLEQADVFEYSQQEWKDLARLLGLSQGYRTTQNLEAYKRILKSRPSENIETLLQRAVERRQIFAQTSPMSFSFSINTVFYRIGWNI